MAPRPLNVLFVTAGLESGGAEMSLFKMVSRMDRTRFHCSVISLTDVGPVLGERIRRQGVSVQALGYKRGSPDPRMILRLARLIRRTRPDIVQTWMYHADLVGGLAARLAGVRRVVWAIHNTDLDPASTKALTRRVVALNGRLSHRVPARITCCSEAALEAHARIGYDAARLGVIHSGIDTDEFMPDSDARPALRRELGLAPGTPLVGLMARFDPQKDHETFLQAAGLLHRDRPDVHFVLCGSGVTEDNLTLSAWADAAGVRGVTHRLGLRRDVAQVTAALDAATCCSRYGESFALVLGEAMACGVPVVTTDMAGPVSVMGGLGPVVPVQDPPALADAWRRLLCLSGDERRAWGARARRHILDHLSLEKTVKGYEDFYERLVGASEGAVGS